MNLPASLSYEISMTQKSVAILNTDPAYAAQLRKAFTNDFIDVAEYQWLNKKLTEDIAIADFVLAGKFNLLGKMPVIIINAGTEENEALSLSKGADMAYSGQPSIRILTERVNCILRRYKPPIIHNKDIVTFGALTLDINRYECFWHDCLVSLKRNEFVLIRKLVENRGKNITRESLLADNANTSERMVDSRIKRIRAKFRMVDPSFNAILTIYGLGYRFDPELVRNRHKSAGNAKEIALQP